MSSTFIPLFLGCYCCLTVVIKLKVNLYLSVNSFALESFFLTLFLTLISTLTLFLILIVILMVNMGGCRWINRQEPVNSFQVQKVRSLDNGCRDVNFRDTRISIPGTGRELDDPP